MAARSPAFPRQLVAFAAGWIFLNAFLNANAPAPNPPFHRLLAPSLEVWAVLLLLSLPALRRRAFSPRVYLPLMGFLLFCRLFRFGDVLMPVYFNRPFNLYVDTGYLPGLIHLLYHSFPGLELAGYGLAAALGGGLCIWVLHRALKTAHRGFSDPRIRRGFWLVTCALVFPVACHMGGGYPDRLGPPVTSIAPRLVSELGFVLRVREVKHKGLSAVQMAEAAMPEFGAPLARLDGRDVHLLLIESYGRTLYDNPRHAEAFLPVARRFQEVLARDGFRVVSTYLRSPTFGGASWLAFSTLETGVWAPDQLRYHYLTHSRVRPLASYFAQAGYRTVSVMPGTTMPWPEGRYFSYDEMLAAADLGYRGPAFGWSPMPDQFVLEAVRQRELTRRKAPLFIRYVLISSHAPFHHQPPYIEDWDRIGDGSVYRRLEGVRYPNNWPDLTGAGEAYRRSVAYDLDVIAGFLSRSVHDGSLVIVMGDHQPNAQITGEGASWDVPVHVVSRSRDLLETFLAMGYSEGIVPDGSGATAGMDEFMPAFLTAFSLSGESAETASLGKGP
jgi:hypothetical protein